MKKQIKTVVYDEQLRLEAFRFEDFVQPFSNHFHEYYVIGLVEKGRRLLSCKNREYVIGAEDYGKAGAARLLPNRCPRPGGRLRSALPPPAGHGGLSGIRKGGASALHPVPAASALGTAFS